MKYYILINNKTAGPFSIEDVERLYNNGNIETTSMYATPDSQDWMPVSLLIPLFGKKQAEVPPIPQPTPYVVINNSNIQNVPYTNVPSRVSRPIYVILALLLGSLGIHNFYANRTGTAVAQLLLTLLTLGYAAIFVWLWAVIECFVVSKDGKNLPMQ